MTNSTTKKKINDDDPHGNKTQSNANRKQKLLQQKRSQPPRPHSTPPFLQTQLLEHQKKKQTENEQQKLISEQIKQLQQLQQQLHEQQLQLMQQQQQQPQPQPQPSNHTITVDDLLSAAATSEAVKEFDNYCKANVTPLAFSCDSFDKEAMGKTGNHILAAWEGMRGIIVLSTRAKAPEGDYAEAIAPFLEKTQEAVKAIHASRFPKEYDFHYKALIEMLACLSWVLHKAPKQIPATIVKEAISSSDFWLNRVRKEKKDDDVHITFCNNIKNTLTGLVKYIEAYHKTGLSWNPRGVSLAEATAVLGDEPDTTSLPPKSPGRPQMNKRLSIKAIGGTAGGNMAGMMSELAGRKSADGSSAATGLKHVSKSQQTWRKDYKKDEKELKVPTLEEMKQKKEAAAGKGKMKAGLPIFEYQERGFKWVIENHTAQSAKKESESGVIVIEITDPKQQVYMYNCTGVTVQVKYSTPGGLMSEGKFKSMCVDKCTKCNVVFHTIISSAEIVNSSKIQIQTNGICPVFTIDKTNGVLVWLSEDSKKVSSFVASQSSEMNVSFPDGDDQKELPIPEQFVHRLVNGAVKSEVSDLYH